MNYKEILENLNTPKTQESRLGLERITELLNLLDNPEKKMKIVHIAGTNGKGSCSAMMASVLKASGLKTGLFTSPHLFRYNERMQINGKQIEDEDFAAVATSVLEAGDKMEDRPSQFEFITAIALVWFAREGCDYAVLEVGMGGRFDATNVCDRPEVEIIMNIGLDHTATLGDTLEKIAFEKAGIIKKDTDVVLYQQNDSVEKVISDICIEREARLHITDFSAIEPEFDSLEGQSFNYKGNNYAIPLLGKHQRKNAAVVIDAIEILREHGETIEQCDLEYGLYSVYWPARFEICAEDPYFVVDGGHNPQCATTVVDNLANYFPDEKHIMLVGVLKDKDYETLFKILNLAASEYVCVTPDSQRALSAENLGRYLEKFGKPVTVCETIEDGVFTALEKARDEEGMVCAVGSLYMAGEIRDNLGLY